MAEIPESADLRQFLWGVENARAVPVSAASAAATALEYHCNRINEPATNFSTMFIHYNAAAIAGTVGQNIGTTLENAMKAITEHGACREETWPFDPAKVAVRPSAQAYEEAKKFSKVRSFNPLDVCQAISMKYPVAFVASLPMRCMDEAGRTGAMPAPTADEMKGSLFHHAMVLVAYDKRANTVTARNCWGTAWGKDGHCTIPIDALKLIAPYGVQRIWVIASPESVKPQDQPGVAAAPAAPQPGNLGDMAAKMKEDIRDSLKKDLEEAQKRIRDMMKKRGAQ